ncbi:recombinase family protein [Rhizobium sp. NTR19]|uniref:Recombinase family protein n=1 Tax=Neorhizobium turbinariae TaxID=2937795 RepID=A0ABT0IW63_9HYPH|nr:recombinase family protein [Neorhizobium turbinariae]MCK8782095.1 recombinase family protein [Neorhizobium turbinariae]
MEQKQQRPKAYSYVRMSSQQQIKGDSLRRQLERSRKYAADNGLDLDETLRDIGVSAWTGKNVKRGALGRFLELVQTGRVERGSYLLVESLDRLSRQQVRFAISPFVDIINAGITIVTLADNQVYSENTVDENWTQLMMSLAIMSRAHEESQTKSDRLKEAHARQKRDAARGIGRFSSNMFGWIDTVRNGEQFEYRLNQHADTIRKIYEMADAGLGQLIITRRLNEANIPSFKGTPWQQPNVGNILRNEAVIGTYQPTHSVDRKTVPNGPPLKNYLPAAVSEELFWRVQRNKRTRTSAGKKGQLLSNLFTGLCSCAQCHGPIRMRSSGNIGNDLKYLHCDNRYRNIGCDSAGGNFRYDLFEKAILDHVKEFELSLSNGSTTERKEDLLRRLHEKEAQLETLERRRKNLLRAVELTDDEAAARDLLAQLADRRIEVEQATAQVSEIKGDLARLQAQEGELASVAERIQLERLRWSTGTPQEIYESRSRVAKTLAQYIDVISFDFNSKTVMVSLGGGLLIYQFDQKGNLLHKRDNRHMVKSVGPSVVWKAADENGRPIEGSGQIIKPRGLTLDNLASDIPHDDMNQSLVEQRKAIARELLLKR